MPILHKNINTASDIHVPKWHPSANNGDYAWKNEVGDLESLDELLLPSALDFVDASVAPPTTNAGDIYVLSSGVVDPSWGSVSTLDWVRYDGTDWNSITPQKSSLCYNKTTDSLLSFNGTAWVEVGGGIANVDGAEKAALTPTEGDFVYDTDLDSLQRYDGSSWVDIAKGYGSAVRYTDGIPYFYDTLKLAYDSASAGDVVKTCGNLTDTSGDSITLKANVVLDLNGFTYTWDNSGANNVFNATTGVVITDLVTIKNGKIIKTGGGSGSVINNTTDTTWALNNLFVRSDSVCILMTGIIDAYGSFFEGDTTANSCRFTSGAQRVFGGYYKNVNATGTNSSDAQYMGNTVWEAVGGNGCSIGGKVNDSIFISDSGVGLASSGNAIINKCFAFSDTGTAADISDGECHYLYAVSQSGRGIDATGCDLMTHSTGISEGANFGVRGANLNYHCNGISESSNAWNNGGSPSPKLYNCTAKVNSGTSSAIFNNVNNVEMLNCSLEVASSSAWGISPVLNHYAAGNLVKGTNNMIQGTNLWVAAFDAANNSAQL